MKEQAYNPAMDILCLGKRYSSKRLESASELALTRFNVPRYRHLQVILAVEEDLKFKQQKDAAARKNETQTAGYIRGAAYYGWLKNDYEETRRKLQELSLEEMVTALDLQDKDPGYLHMLVEDRMKMLVDYVYQKKYIGKVKLLLKSARFRISNVDIHGVYYTDRNIDRAQLTELATCQLIANARNILFHGFTGSGKSFLACAIGKEDCKQGIWTHYIRILDLLMEWADALSEKQGVLKLLKKYSNYNLLILAEWLIQIPTEEEQHFLFELIERRYDESSTIFCTQYWDEECHSRLGGGILVDSILDRVVHRTVRFYSGDINMRVYMAKRSL